jgi:outer membrane protein
MHFKENELKHALILKLRFLLLGLVTGLAVALPVRADSLADTLVSAYNNSGLLEQNRALLRAADEDVAQTLAGLRPIINWSSDATRNYSRNRTSPFGVRKFGQTDLNVGITGDLLLLDAGRTRFQLEAAKETVLATRQTLIGIEQQVLLRAIQAHMNVRRNIEFVSIRENNLRLLQQELRAAKDRYEVGEVTRTDVAQAEARLAAAYSGLATAEGDLEKAVEEYRSAVGRKPGNLAPPAKLPKLASNVDEAKTVALRGHPDVVKIRHDVSAAELAIKAADAAQKPTLNLTGRLGAGDELGGRDFTRSGSVGLSVTGPIYQGGRLSALKRQAMARRDALRGALHFTSFEIERGVGDAYANLRAAYAGRSASEEQVRAARVAFRGVREEAKLGARTTLDVLDAEQELLNAEANLISTQTDVYIAAYAVLSSLGQLTVRDLNLGVQSYDPSAYYNLAKTAPVPLSKRGAKLDKVLRALGRE